MSTRSIIGLIDKDGTIKAAWQWCDGYETIKYLRKYFRTKELAEELINEGCYFSSIFTASEKASFETWEKKYAMDGTYLQLSNDIYLRKRLYEFLQKNPIHYNSIREMLGEDVSYIYIFDEKTCSWVRIDTGFKYDINHKRWIKSKNASHKTREFLKHK